MRGSRTAEVRFEDCEVPAESLVGEDGKAFEYAKAMLNGSRIIMGSICVGIARMAYRKALDYSQQRGSSDRELSDLQMTREKIANMRTEITLRALALPLRLPAEGDWASSTPPRLRRPRYSRPRWLRASATRAIQIFGGYGYTNGDVHRHWRDARLLTIGEGASEVLRMLIAARKEDDGPDRSDEHRRLRQARRRRVGAQGGPAGKPSPPGRPCQDEHLRPERGRGGGQDQGEEGRAR